MPAIVMALVLFFPETVRHTSPQTSQHPLTKLSQPRWLVMKDRREEAIQVLAKYHGEGDPNAPIVRLQIAEIVEDMAVTRNDNPWWDFKELVHTGAARYRLYMVIAMAFFGQWSGNNVVSYFMPQMIENAGIEDTNKQLLINAINPIFSMLAAIYGATLLDRLGRRTMLMGGLAGALFSYVLLTAFTASSQSQPNLAYGTIVAIYLFGIFFA